MIWLRKAERELEISVVVQTAFVLEVVWSFSYYQGKSPPDHLKGTRWSSHEEGNVHFNICITRAGLFSSGQKEALYIIPDISTQQPWKPSLDLSLHYKEKDNSSHRCGEAEWLTHIPRRTKWISGAFACIFTSSLLRSSLCIRITNFRLTILYSHKHSPCVHKGTTTSWMRAFLAWIGVQYLARCLKTYRNPQTCLTTSIHLKYLY